MPQLASKSNNRKHRKGKSAPTRRAAAITIAIFPCHRAGALRGRLAIFDAGRRQLCRQPVGPPDGDSRRAAVAARLAAAAVLVEVIHVERGYAIIGEHQELAVLFRHELATSDVPWRPSGRASSG